VLLLWVLTRETIPANAACGKTFWICNRVAEAQSGKLNYPKKSNVEGYGLEFGLKSGAASVTLQLNKYESRIK